MPDITIKTEYASIEEVPEEVRSLYVEKEGKFVLDDVTNLRNAIGHTKRERDQFKTRAKELEGLEVYKDLGLSVEEIKEMVKAQEEKKTKEAEEKGDFEALLNQHKNTWDKERQQLEKRVEVAESSERKAVIDNQLISNLTKAGATEEGVDLLPDRLSKRIDYQVENDQRVVRILSDDLKTPMAGNGGGGLASFEDLVEEAKTKWPSLFKGSGQSGSGAHEKEDGGNPPGGGGQKPKRSAMSVTEKTSYIREHGSEAYENLPA